MKIETFKKLKNGQYQLQLEDCRQIVIYEDLILKYELLLNKQVTNELIDKIQKDNTKYESYYASLKYLKNQLRSQKEIEEYLNKKEYTKEEIEFTILRLSKQGYLNDLNYAKVFVEHQLILTSNGPSKIKFELQKKGITEDNIEEALKIYTVEKMQDKITKLIHKMQKSNHNKSNQVLKQKIITNLSNQGFPKNMIISLLTEVSLVDDQDIAKKEYEKLYQKLKRKYSGKELEYKIKQKMYQKGFDYYE